MKKRFYLLPAIILSAPLAKISGTEEKSAEEHSSVIPINRLQITYLATSKEYKKAIDLYTEYRRQTGKHDFEILEHLSRSILQDGVRSQDMHAQLLSIYASSLAGLDAPCEILEVGVASPHMQTQLASLQFLARLQDDKIDYLLQKAMNSDFLYTRLEAAYILASKKARSAAGQIEALMHKLPPPMRIFFPELFAILGSEESIHILKHLMDDPFHPIRIEAILSAARHGRDDLLSMIRSSSTHIDISEQEACAAALGYLKDTKSLRRLKKLSDSPSEYVQLAALRSLYSMGDESAKERIISKAQEKNCFAIAMLGEIEDSQDTLHTLCKDTNITVRFNAVMSLLKRKDARALAYLHEFLIRDSRDIGFQPQTSTGGSLRTWKVISSTEQHAKQSYIDLHATTLFVKESILKDALELQESAFIELAKMVFDARENQLIPLLVSLVENQKSPLGINLLKTRSQTAGAPLVRAYCTLALCRLKESGPFEENIKTWIKAKFQHQLVEFRPAIPLNSRLSDYSFELTPEENSALLIESYQYLAESHSEENIDFLLDAIRQANPKNVTLLAGILLKAVQ